MAQPIPLEIPPRNPRAELRARLEQAPEEHAEAVLAAYVVLQELHNRGVLEVMRGALAASDEIRRGQYQNAGSDSCYQELAQTPARGRAEFGANHSLSYQNFSG